MEPPGERLPHVSRALQPSRRPRERGGHQVLGGSLDVCLHDYTQAALAGDAEGAKAISASLDPVRKALWGTRPPEKPHSHQKYWQELLGQVGGAVRFPLLELTDEEKAITRDAFEQCGLQT